MHKHINRTASPRSTGASFFIEEAWVFHKASNKIASERETCAYKKEFDLKI